MAKPGVTDESGWQSTGARVCWGEDDIEENEGGRKKAKSAREQRPMALAGSLLEFFCLFLFFFLGVHENF